jgi:hypothetical protein
MRAGLKLVVYGHIGRLVLNNQKYQFNPIQAIISQFFPDKNTFFSTPAHGLFHASINLFAEAGRPQKAPLSGKDFFAAS